MKRKRLTLAAIAAVCLVGLAGCSVVEKAADKAAEVHGYVHTLKEKGCDALSDRAKRVLVTVIKSRIQYYPPNGICSSAWVQDVLIEKLGGLKGESGIHNGSEDLGYSTDSGNGSLVESDRVGVPFESRGGVGGGAGWVSDGSSFYSSVGALVHASGLDAHSGGGGDTRLLLHASLQQHQQVAGGSDSVGGNGSCDNPGSRVEAGSCMVCCSSGWSGRLVA